MKLPEPPSERIIFGLLLVGAFLLAMGTLAWHPLPGPKDSTKNAELFGQGLVALIGSIGIIVGAIWKTSATERQQADNLTTLVNRLPDPPKEPPSPGATAVTVAAPAQVEVKVASGDAPPNPAAPPPNPPGE